MADQKLFFTRLTGFDPSSRSLKLFATFLAEGDGVVHDPADESHDQPQQNEKDPVLSDPQDQELLTARRTH